MSDIETETLTGSGGEALPQAEEVKPKVEGETEGGANPEQKTGDGAGENAEEGEQNTKQKKRSREYFQQQQEKMRLYQRQWNDPAVLESRLNELKRREPRLDDVSFDQESFVRESLRHDREVMRTEMELEHSKAVVAQVEQNFTYAVSDFAQDHPDYAEVVSSIPGHFLPQELQFAIMAHERGPEIAYHIALNDDDLFQLASIRPELMGAAVDRLAKRLAAPQQKPSAQPKPTTKAPPPPMTVSGRNPTETPPEKLTDEEWEAAYWAKRGRK